MKFYVGSLEGVPRYGRTQSDAKPLQNVEVVDLKTDHASLVQRFNDLIDQGIEIGRSLGPIQENGDADSVGAEEIDQAGEGTAPGEKTTPDTQAQPAKTGRRQPADTYQERSHDQIMAEEFIHAVRSDESYRLDVLERMIASRREEIARGVDPA